jgi:small-conductance mechanosensitive channel
MTRDRPASGGSAQRRDADVPGDPDPGPPDPRGRLSTTSAGAVVGFALVGLVLGWLVRPVSLQVGDTAPTVSWLPFLALLFVALVVGSLAWSTHRALHRRRERMEPHQAVNRLVLAKASALAGSLVAGGYFGYALSWLGLTDAQLAHQRVLHCVLAGVAGVVLVINALLLERACRISSDDRA